jgi:lactate permease
VADIFGTGISASVQPLYLPGTVFIVTSLITYTMHRPDAAAYRHSWSASLKVTAAASVALVFTVPMVQVFINSGGGSAGYARMPIALADGVAALAGSAWPMVAPFIGGLGAAVAGSNTVSNMMFALFQFEMGQRILVDPMWIVALQAVGGAAGNMICVHNVVAASAVVGLLGREGVVIRLTLLPFIYYALRARRRRLLHPHVSRSRDPERRDGGDPGDCLDDRLRDRPARPGTNGCPALPMLEPAR